MVVTVPPTGGLGPIPLLHPQEALAHTPLGPESPRTVRARRRCLTSPAPALRTALMKDMIAVFRFTSSRYRPKLRSSSFSSVWMERQDRREKAGSGPYKSSLCAWRPSMPHLLAIPNQSSLPWTFLKAQLFQEVSFASPCLGLRPAPHLQILVYFVGLCQNAASAR